MNEFIFSSIVIVIIVSNMAVAFWRRKEKASFQTYAADPNEYGMVVIAITVTGTVVGGGMFLAVGQIGYEAGLVGFVFGLVYLVGFLLIGVFSGKLRRILDEKNHDTLIELLEDVYDKRTVIQFCLVNFAMYTFLLAAQFVAMLKFCQYLELDSSTYWPRALIVLGFVAIMVYPIIGGLRKDIQTDIIQFAVVLIASILIISKIAAKGEVGEIWAKLPEGHLTGTGYGAIFTLGVIIFYTPSFLVRMDVWQRIRAAKDVKSSRYGFWLAGIFSCFFYFLFTLIGMWAYVLKLPDASFASLEIIKLQFSDPWILGLIFGAFFAAVLSSADTFVNNITLFGSWLLAGRYWKDKSEKQVNRRLLITSQGCGLVMIMVSIVLAFIAQDFVDLFVGALSLLLIYLPCIAGLLVPEWRNTAAAFYSGLTGTILFLLLFFSWNAKFAFAPAVLTSIVTYASFNLIRSMKRFRSELTK